jgi:triphosphoribosyl-dephospho-CoA synthetase
MPLFSLCVRDRSGRVLNDTNFEAADVYRALAHANTELASAYLEHDGGFDVKGHIDVREQCGTTVARLVCAEAIAGMH